MIKKEKTPPVLFIKRRKAIAFRGTTLIDSMGNPLNADNGGCRPNGMLRNEFGKFATLPFSRGQLSLDAVFCLLLSFNAIFIISNGKGFCQAERVKNSDFMAALKA